jgi:hypothetical protein
MIMSAVAHYQYGSQEAARPRNEVTYTLIAAIEPDLSPTLRTSSSLPFDEMHGGRNDLIQPANLRAARNEASRQHGR